MPRIVVVAECKNLQDFGVARQSHPQCPNFFWKLWDNEALSKKAEVASP
jgi:hypothetical protein